MVGLKLRPRVRQSQFCRMSGSLEGPVTQLTVRRQGRPCPWVSRLRVCACGHSGSDGPNGGPPRNSITKFTIRRLERRRYDGDCCFWGGLSFWIAEKKLWADGCSCLLPHSLPPYSFSPTSPRHSHPQSRSVHKPGCIGRWPLRNTLGPAAMKKARLKCAGGKLSEEWRRNVSVVGHDTPKPIS